MEDEAVDEEVPGLEASDPGIPGWVGWPSGVPSRCGLTIFKHFIKN